MHGPKSSLKRAWYRLTTRSRLARNEWSAPYWEERQGERIVPCRRCPKLDAAQGVCTVPFGSPLRKCVVAATEAHLRGTRGQRVLELGFARRSYGKRIVELSGGSWTGVEPLLDRTRPARLGSGGYGHAGDIPFIFVSGTIGEERAIEVLQRGAYDYVLKTNLGRLVPAVKRALDEAASRRARQSLEQQLRDIVITSQDWIWEHDRDGKFTFCSDSARQILGYAPSELLGTNAAQYIHPEDLAAIDFAMHTLGPNQRTASNLQARWRHRRSRRLSLRDSAG